MGSGSSTTQLLNAQKLPDSGSEGRDKFKTTKKSSDQQRELDAFSLAEKYKMKAEEVKLLWERFQQLGPDKSGHVDRAVFSDSDIYSNIFCKQVWGRIAGLEEDSSKISFEKFLTNMRQYQYESGEEKLRSTLCNYAYCYYGNWGLYLTGYFDWMSNDDNQVTRDRLKIIVRHATHDQDEDSSAADSKVDMMMTIMDPQKKGYISCDDFLKFINDIPEDQLSPVLAFTILPDDSGHHSEHSSQESEPI